MTGFNGPIARVGMHYCLASSGESTIVIWMQTGRNKTSNNKKQIGHRIYRLSGFYITKSIILSCSIRSIGRHRSAPLICTFLLQEKTNIISSVGRNSRPPKLGKNSWLGREPISCRVSVTDFWLRGLIVIWALIYKPGAVLIERKWSPTNKRERPSFDTITRRLVLSYIGSGPPSTSHISAKSK